MSKEGKFINISTSHRRFDPLSGKWVLVSPGRLERPWDGRSENIIEKKKLKYDPNCYLCPGNYRSRGVRNPEYDETFIFDNDFPALQLFHEQISIKVPSWMNYKKEIGICRVICYSPRHDLSFSDLLESAALKVIIVLIGQLKELKKHPEINYVQIFENRGKMMGCSNEHPHGQIWATKGIPDIVKTEDYNQGNYSKKHRSCLLCDVFDYEVNKKERLVLENESWIVIIPFWAVWPYETLLISRRHISCLMELTENEQITLVQIWQDLIKLYDKLFDTSMPFSFGWHFSPKNSSNQRFWHLHAHFYPPVLRSATVRKFMVGYEMLAETQRDISPEQAAKHLREKIVHL